MNDKPFFDTNVILYAFRQDDKRSEVAESLLSAGGRLSVQVLNEFVAVSRRKLDKSWEEVRCALDILRVFCPEPVSITVETHERAVHIAERYGYSNFDALQGKVSQLDRKYTFLSLLAFHLFEKDLEVIPESELRRSWTIIQKRS